MQLVLYVSARVWQSSVQTVALCRFRETYVTRTFHSEQQRAPAALRLRCQNILARPKWLETLFYSSHLNRAVCTVTWGGGGPLRVFLNKDMSNKKLLCFTYFSPQLFVRTACPWCCKLQQRCELTSFTQKKRLQDEALHIVFILRFLWRPSTSSNWVYTKLIYLTFDKWLISVLLLGKSLSCRL